jgi:hypothetical protein
MRLTLRVDYENGTAEEVVCSAADLVAFEATYSRSVARLEQEMRFTDLLYLAWHSSHRRKKTTATFEAWVDTVATIGAGEEDPKSKGSETKANTGS